MLGILGAGLLLGFVGASAARAQTAAEPLPMPPVASPPATDSVPAPPPLEGGAEAMIQMSLQGTVPLDALLRYVSQRLKINYDYSTEIGKQTITIQTPAEIPVRSLPLLVSSALRSAGLALVDSDVPGWKRIVNSNEMVKHASFGNVVVVL